MTRVSLVCLECLLLVSLVGCSGDLSSLSGKVTIDGSPAPKGIALQFTPIDGGSPSSAVTDDQGNYEAEFSFTRKGIQLGTHRVALMPGGGGGIDDGKMPEIGADGNPIEPQSKPAPAPKFPREYYQEIMQITVEKGRNQIDLPLSTQATES